MELDALLNGLQEISYAEGLDSGFSPHYINTINTQIASYKDKIVSKLGLNTHAKLYGGAIQLEFGDNTRPFPEAQIRAMGEEHVFSQLGGGFLTDLKHFVFGRNINKFYAEFEKIMLELSDKVKPYEVEAEELAKFSNQKADKVRDLMLTGKSKAIMEVNLTDMDLDANRRDYLKKQIALANSNKPIFFKSIEEIAKRVQMKETDSTIFGITYKRSMVRRLKEEIDKKYKKFDKLVKKYEEYVDLITRGNNLREKYSKFTEAEVKNLLDDQKAEYKEYKAFDKKYAGQDYTNFTQAKLNEAKALLDKLSLSLIAINDYITAFNKITGQKADAEKTLSAWERDVTTLFTNMNKAIKEGNKYKAALDRIKTLVEDNHNYLASVATRDLEPAVQEYDKHKRSVGYTKETMDKLISTLVEMRNRFLKLEPAQNLIMDAFTISQARTYILAMMENISIRQTTDFGGDYASGEGYIKKIVGKRQRGGAYPDIQQYGGVYQFTDDITTAVGDNIIPIYFKHIGNDMIYFGGKYNKYSEAKKVAGGQYMDNPVVLPYGALPLDDDEIDGVDDKYKLKNKYAAFFAKVKQPVIYFPIYNINTGQVTVYKVEIKPGFDIREPSKHVTLVKVKPIELTRDKGPFIKLPSSSDYYIYNINFADHELNDELNNYSIGDDTNILLPVFYKMGEVKDGFMNYEEMHLINPITGAPILTVIDKLPAKVDRQPLVFKDTDLNVELYGINSPDMLEDVIGGKKNKYYYHYNAIGIEYNINNISLDYPGQTKHPFIGANTKLRDNNNCKMLHAALMFQVIDFTNQQVKKLLTDGEDGIELGDPSSIDVGVANTILNIENIGDIGQIFGADEEDAISLFAKTLFADILPGNKGKSVIGLKSGKEAGIYPEPTLTATLAGTIAGVAASPVMVGAPVISPEKLSAATTAAMAEASKSITDTDAIAKAAAGATSGDATVIAAAKAAADTAAAAPGATPTTVATAAATAAVTAAAAAIIPPTTALNPLLPSSPSKADVQDSVRRSLEYVLRLLPKTSKYWSNLGLIRAEIDKFYKGEYKDNFEKVIAEITQAIFEMRKDEVKILGIAVNIPKSPLPGYSMAVKDMEIKPNKEEGITTEAAKELQNILSNNRQFIEKFQAAAGVNSATLIQDLQSLFFKIAIKNSASDVNVLEWFNADPSRQPYLDYIRTLPGAQDLERQIKSNPELGNHDLKIFRAIGRVVLPGTPAYEKVYEFYEKKGKDEDKKKEEAKRQLAKGGHHRGQGRGGNRGTYRQ